MAAPARRAPPTPPNASSAKPKSDGLARAFDYHTQTADELRDVRMKDLDYDKPFDDIITDQDVLQAIYNLNFDSPSWIQAQAIPALTGSPPKSVIAQAPSGSGKTIAFVSALFIRVDRNLNQLQGICLTHTGVLTDQVFKVISQMNEMIKATIGWAANREFHVFPNSESIPQILVGTPAGVVQAIIRWKLDTSRVQLVVLDEADRLLRPPREEGADLRRRGEGEFIDDIEALLGRLRGRGRGGEALLPPTATVGFFSASFSNQIRETCKKWRPDVEEFTRREVPRVIDHFFTVVRDPDQAAPQILKQYYCAQVDSGQAIVFFSQKERVKEFVREMNDAKFTCRAIHGEVPFDERRQTISDFRDEKFKVLAATDIIARGFDVPQVFLIVQVGVRWESPDDTKTGGHIGTDYQHRAGRAGRYGRTGACLSIVRPREIRMLQDIEKDLNIQITELRPDQVVGLPKETEVVPDPAPRRAATQAPQ